MEKDAGKCRFCGHPATEVITPDMDIVPVPVCDYCKYSILFDLYSDLDEFTNIEELVYSLHKVKDNKSNKKKRGKK
jgi:hypothetical protein